MTLLTAIRSSNSRIPSSKAQLWDAVVDQEGSPGSSDDHHAVTKPSRLLLSQHTYLSQLSSTLRSSPDTCGSVPMQQHHEFPRPVMIDATVTDSTKFSDSPTSCVGNSSSSLLKKKKSSRRRLKIGFSILKLPSAIAGRSRRKPLSESQLRKRVKKSAEKGDWDAVRKLINNYAFSDIPQEESSKIQLQAQTNEKRDSFVSKNPLQGEPTGASASRRPSYGSRKGERRSFTGKESAAAAAVIKAALLEESIDSGESVCHHTPPSIVSFGENILHDVCRCQPPLDVTETLLKALRHRRGSTSDTDDLGRTPLHLAANYGASPQVIHALVRADPCPASMGDVERRSPMHLAVKYLAYNGYISSANELAIRGTTPEEALDKTYQSVQILKDAMLIYPGRIDFKDEDETGYSPLDYAIAGNVSKEEMIECLIRRKEPRVGRRRSFAQPKRGLARPRRGSLSSVGDDQDIEILRKLEQDEIEARRHRIEKIKARRKQVVMKCAIFDLFGIEEHSAAAAAAAIPAKEVIEPAKESSPEDDDKLVDETEREQAALDVSDSDIYNRHLEDYLEDFMDDFEGYQDLEFYQEDDGGEFDLLEDPEEAQMQDGAGVLDGNTSFPLSVIIVTINGFC